MKKIVSLLSGLWLAGCSVMGIRNAPEPEYQVLLRDGEFEIRAYPSLLVAETLAAADYPEAGSIGFKRLAGYIFGGNTRREKVVMTTPVLREAEGEEIAMTAPVLQQTDGRLWRMSFVMPAGYSLETLPIPLDTHVELHQLPAKKVAVLQYSGSLSEGAITRNSQKLLEWLNQQSFKPISSARSAAYDPPWTLPMLRRNEIHVDIE
ncbi:MULTISPECIES: SOUL family heme-binding protein [Methylomonas]|uniref:SOUL family heme-binding protein n=1 Tax=Methylomonas TaxID=416 RepID=UPI0012328E3C|nr:heme-binding protein [Methylomonas rhizoryzae]